MIPRTLELIADDIDGQIVARDFKLIDQSDMILIYFPQDVDGRPIIAGGVQSELGARRRLNKGHRHSMGVIQLSNALHRAERGRPAAQP